VGAILAAPPAPAPGVPEWLTVTILIASPLLLLIGVLIGHRVTRQGTKELDTRAKREELLRMVRWAGEQIPKGVDEGRIAVAVLRAAGASAILQEGDQAFIDAIIDGSIAEPVEAYHEADVETEGTRTE
jgi:hypothetical protein